MDHPIRLCICVQQQVVNGSSEVVGGQSAVALHSFNSTHHYEFVLHVVNVTEFDLHRYDLQVSNDLGTTLGSVHVYLGQFNFDAYIHLYSP